jgi:hypothetical protein
MLVAMWRMQMLFDFVGSAGAARNAGSVLEAHRTALAEVDSAVARLQRHAQAVRPAA